MTIKAGLTLLAITYILAAAVFWQSCQIFRATNNLPPYTIPATATPQTVNDINPQAITALQQLHAMGEPLDSNSDITMPLHTSEFKPVFEFLRTTIQYRGGATFSTCRHGSRPPNCTLDAALPEPLFNELNQLAGADAEEFQAWIDQQPTTYSWDAQPDLIIAHIDFQDPFVAAWPLQGRSSSVRAWAIVIMAVSWTLAILITKAAITAMEMRQEEMAKQEKRARRRAAQTQA